MGRRGAVAGRGARARDGAVRYGNDAAAVARDPEWTVLRSFKRFLADAGPQTRVEAGGHSLLLADLLAGHFRRLREEIVAARTRGRGTASRSRSR